MSEEHFSPNHKRVKFEANEENGEGEGALTVRANSRIHLCFHDLLLKAPFHAFPAYTHQLFDNEEIPVASEHEKKNLKVEVHIDTRTFRQAVNITGIDAESDTMANLVAALKKGVAPDATFHNEHHFKFLSMRDETLDERELLTPPGTLLHSITLKDEGDDREEYAIYRCSSNNTLAAKVLSRAERVAMWFIETASAVDFLHNPQWELLLLYQKGRPILKPQRTFAADGSVVHVDPSSSSYVPSLSALTSTTHSLVGHLTLFTFHSPSQGGVSDRVRVCQAMVLPYKQSHGLGRELLLSVYTSILAPNAQCVELTVEDPCVGFQRLRDTVDYEWTLSVAEKHGWEHWQSVDDEALHGALKIVPTQIVFVKEVKEYLDLVLSLREQRTAKRRLSLVRENSVEGGLSETEEEGKATEHKGKEDAEDEEAESEREKISPYEIQHWTDIERLKFLHDQVETHADFAAFRLKVKRNLLKEDKELKYLEKKAMRATLKALFEERMVRYHHVLRALHRQKLLDADLLSDEALGALL